MKRIFYLLVLGLAILGCQNDDAVAVVVAEDTEEEVVEIPEEVVEVPETIAFTEVTAGNFPNSVFPFPAGNYVINSQADWTIFLTHPQANAPISINLTLDHELHTYLAVRHDYHAHTNSSVKIYVESVV